MVKGQKKIQKKIFEIFFSSNTDRWNFKDLYYFEPQFQIKIQRYQIKWMPTPFTSMPLDLYLNL